MPTRVCIAVRTSVPAVARVLDATAAQSTPAPAQQAQRTATRGSQMRLRMPWPRGRGRRAALLLH